MPRDSVMSGSSILPTPIRLVDAKSPSAMDEPRTARLRHRSAWRTSDGSQSSPVDSIAAGGRQTANSLVPETTYTMLFSTTCRKVICQSSMKSPATLLTQPRQLSLTLMKDDGGSACPSRICSDMCRLFSPEQMRRAYSIE